MFGRLKLDSVTWIYLGLVAVGGILYTSFELTPSSYGLVLTQIGAPEEGPVLGTARFVRSDEWAISTPLFQAAVRNGFQRINETSFYREDLRNPTGLPLKDWSLLFKPEMWGFFVASPAFGYSAYFALMMCACLAGYQLLFRQLGVHPLLAAAVAVIIYFSGFTQFWWTTFAPHVAVFPWILIILFSALRWWQKALLYSWLLPVCSLAYLYPALVAELAFAAIVIVIAIRPSLLRDWRELTAVAIGGVVMIAVVYAYYADIIPAMRSTLYPGHRIAPPGSGTVASVLSQFFPYVSFSLGNYRNFRAFNICELAALGSFLPVLTLCVTRYRAVQEDQFVGRALTVMAAALLLITCWEVADAPRWIGHILFWDIGTAHRLMLISGLLILIASLLIWSRNLTTLSPFRILLFVVAGPVMSVALKLVLYHEGVEASLRDLLLCGLVAAIAVAACLLRETWRAPVLFFGIALINVYSFGRFNPLQSAGPIFQIPETDVVQQLRHAQDSSPDHLLVDRRFLGATPNGMGFRSVSHALSLPSLTIFRQYFPTMDAERFNTVFNRFSYVQVTDEPLPNSPFPNMVNVPKEAFEPVRNVRQVTLETSTQKDCSIQKGGGVDRVAADGGQLVIDGWAPWRGEDKTQELHIVSARSVRPGSMVTIKRPDVAETMKDYSYARSGFRVTLSSSDGKPLLAEDVILIARNTTQGVAQLKGCGCK